MSQMNFVHIVHYACQSVKQIFELSQRFLNFSHFFTSLRVDTVYKNEGSERHSDSIAHHLAAYPLFKEGGSAPPG